MARHREGSLCVGLERVGVKCPQLGTICPALLTGGLLSPSPSPSAKGKGLKHCEGGGAEEGSRRMNAVLCNGLRQSTPRAALKKQHPLLTAVAVSCSLSGPALRTLGGE